MDGSIDVHGIFAGFQGLGDPCLQQVAFACALLTPNVDKLAVFMPQNVHQLGIFGAEKFIEAGVIVYGKIENKLVHGNISACMGIGGILRCFSGLYQGFRRPANLSKIFLSKPAFGLKCSLILADALCMAAVFLV